MVYGQYDSEVRILRSLAHTGIRWKVCCEFGAWDGLKFSNTAHLLREHGWRGHLIESHPDRFADLVRNSEGLDCVLTHAMVSPENVNDLVPAECDFLSIDIDGNDYWVWEALKHTPSVVCIEFNSRIKESRPYDRGYVRPEWDYGFGAPRDAMEALAEQKGYVLLESDNQVNLYFGLKALL